MKKMLIIAISSMLFAFGLLKAQVHCPIPCSQEQFPYLFCVHGQLDPDPVCSSDPNNEGGQVVKAYLPNCIHVDQTSPSGALTGMPTVGKTQALGPPPGPEPPDTCGNEPFPGITPPSREQIYEEYVNSGGEYLPWQTPWPQDSSVWGDDYNAYLAGLAQWGLDSTNFFNGLAQESVNTTGMDDSAISTVNYYLDNDYSFLFNRFNAQESEYVTDSTANANWLICDSTFQAADSAWQVACRQVQYVTVWNDSIAQNDANIALSEWYSACSGIQTNDCCIRVNFDQDPDHFNTSDYSLNHPVTLALTPYPSCQGGCPDSNSIYINVNVSLKLLFASNLVDPQPDPNYRESVASRTFFTGPNSPTVNPDFETISFRYTIEHELGHWFGFPHSTEGNCPNNVDSCAGYSSIMASSESPNTDPIPPTCEDLNMFRKLYCPETPCQDCVAAVSETVEARNLKAAVFPNPTTGASLLQYTLSDRSMVQIDIFDVLGNEIRAVSSGYEESGIQSISLGTESLPQGHYICRIRVGQNVTNLNVVVER